jgi:hypothetical protein
MYAYMSVVPFEMMSVMIIYTCVSVPCEISAC